jgi:glycosyltransferase involved in cell wall biosynthesis
VVAAVKEFFRTGDHRGEPRGPLVNILQIYPKADYFTVAAMQLRDLAAGLAARGHQVTVATRPSAQWERACATARVRHAPVAMRGSLDLRSAWALARLIRDQHVEVVHCQKGRARSLALLAGLVTTIPVMILNRGVSFPVDRWTRLGYTTSRVSAIVAACVTIKRGLVTSGVPAAKIDVIYSGTDLARFNPGVDGRRIRAELGLAPDHALVTQVGIRSWRGNDDVLEAMARVCHAAPHARLLFVGAPPPRIPSLRDRAFRRGIGHAVSVLGHREDTPEILVASDLVVDASYAGLGLTGSLREALAVETPVIGGIRGHPELIVEARPGCWCRPQSDAGPSHPPRWRTRSPEAVALRGARAV